MSTDSLQARAALYYPFHLCHEQTLERLLRQFAAVHFRDYMALQLTALSGTTAAMNRMGDTHPELVRTGRLVQGYPVSGPLDPEMEAAVDRDLGDEAWRVAFHAALQNDRRFQRGLFDLTHSMRIGLSPMPGPAFFLRLIGASYQALPFSVKGVVALSRRARSSEDAMDYEYGLALVKTSASLVYTVRLCHQHGLAAVTDSPAHFSLLRRTCTRENIVLDNQHLERNGY